MAKMMKMNREIIISLTMLLALLLFPIFFRDNPYIMHLLIVSLIWSVVAASWDLLMGYAGVFAFGALAFFAVGAYTSGMLTLYLGISPWLGILAGGITTALVGIAVSLPCLRLKGVYIALVTFAFHLILVPFIMLGRELGTGGSTGLLGIPPLAVGGYTFTAMEKAPWYFVALIISLISFLVIYKIIHSPIGLAFVALRDAEPFAKSLGINEYKYKLIVFGISAFLTGAIGAFYAHYVTSVSYRILGLDIFLIVMAMLVIGGMGRFPGVVIGAFIVTFVNELLRPTELFRLVIFGAVVVLSVLLMPQGLMGILDFFSKFISRGKKAEKEVRKHALKE